ncbi:dihydrofolate reductase family protein [Schumannella luteola]|uniref:Dihydrofolate reductase n=1 Tax=Schumannella luteola TaxID=472059 RepID=A0A852YAC7_9MICO|nr:dihydrofolate reductase family protein [Schumannella luteola]NYG99916.1 dihydrofolate reductase [Schumannella luteola]TPW90512.1 dihydrofolate reductase [Schumannella luteola]
MAIFFDTATTLDGYLADDDDSLAWLFAVPGGDSPSPELAPGPAAVMVEGSTTYEWVLRDQDLLAHPERWAAFHGDTPVFVFTTRDLPVPAGADVRFVRGPVAEALPQIRAAAGEGDIWLVGGGDLVGQFDDAGALDELRLSYAPVTLGSGAPLLPRRIEAARLALDSVAQVGAFARLVYRVSR